MGTGISWCSFSLGTKFAGFLLLRLYFRGCVSPVHPSSFSFFSSLPLSSVGKWADKAWGRNNGGVGIKVKRLMPPWTLCTGCDHCPAAVLRPMLSVLETSQREPETQPVESPIPHRQLDPSKVTALPRDSAYL